MLAFIDEETPIAESSHTKPTMPFSRLLGGTWLISVLFFYNITFMHPPCSYPAGRVLQMGTDKRQIEIKRKKFNSINFSLLSTSSSLLFFLFWFFYFIFLFFCFYVYFFNMNVTISRIWVRLICTTISIKKQSWNVISWRGQPKKKKSKKTMLLTMGDHLYK